MASKYLSEDNLIYTCNLIGCDKPVSKKCAGCSLVFYCGKDHQTLDWTRHKLNCKLYFVENVESIGKCLIANKDISEGTDILKELPFHLFKELDFIRKDLTTILVAAGAFPYTCIVCEYGKLDLVSPLLCAKCGIPLCSEQCQSNALHSLRECQALQEIKLKETRPVKRAEDISQDVNILRLLLEMKNSSNTQKLIMEIAGQDRVKCAKLNVKDQKNGEIEHLFPLSFKYAKECIKIKSNGIQSTAADLVRAVYFTMKVFGCSVKNSKGLKALYDKRHLVSHSCYPNAEMWIDCAGSHLQLFVRAKCAIIKGERITVCVDDSLLTLPTAERRIKLKGDYNIKCECQRCSNALECELFISGYRCNFSKCQGGYMVPKRPLDRDSDWKCQYKNCKNSISFSQMKECIEKLKVELDNASKYEIMKLEKLTRFVQCYKTSILHTNHYLIQDATTRLGKISTYFLGSGGKLLLCVISEFQHSYKLCEQKNDYIRQLIKLHDKFKVGYKEDWGKLQYELACITLALELTKFKRDERTQGSQSMREIAKTVNKVYSTFKNSIKIWLSQSTDDNKTWIKDAQDFASILSDNFKPIIQNQKLSNSDIKFRCKSVLKNWIQIAKDIKLQHEYVVPESPVDLGGKTILELLMRPSEDDLLGQIKQIKL